MAFFLTKCGFNVLSRQPLTIDKSGHSRSLPYQPKGDASIPKEHCGLYSLLTSYHHFPQLSVVTPEQGTAWEFCKLKTWGLVCQCFWNAMGTSVFIPDERGSICLKAIGTPHWWYAYVEISVEKNLHRIGRIVKMALAFSKPLSVGLYWETVGH